MHRRAHFNKRWTREELQAGIDVCRACHDGIHTLYDEMTLGKRLNTLEALRADEALAKHFSWVSRQRVRGT